MAWLGARRAAHLGMTIPLAPDILHGGLAYVVLPEPLSGHRWRVEWREIGTDPWHIAAEGLEGGVQAVDDTKTPAPQHLIEWWAVAAPYDPQQGSRARARQHDWIDERSRALGAAVGDHLKRDPSLVGRAREQLVRWETNAVANNDVRVLPVLREWQMLLDTLSLDHLIELLREDSTRAARLRQSSPFAGLLPDDERSAIFARYEAL